MAAASEMKNLAQDRNMIAQSLCDHVMCHVPLSQGHVGVSWLLEHKWALPWV